MKGGWAVDKKGRKPTADGTGKPGAIDDHFLKGTVVRFCRLVGYTASSVGFSGPILSLGTP